MNGFIYHDYLSKKTAQPFSLRNLSSPSIKSSKNLPLFIHKELSNIRKKHFRTQSQTEYKYIHKKIALKAEIETKMLKKNKATKSIFNEKQNYLNKKNFGTNFVFPKDKMVRSIIAQILNRENNDEFCVEVDAAFTKKEEKKDNVDSDTHLKIILHQNISEHLLAFLYRKFWNLKMKKIFEKYKIKKKIENENLLKIKENEYMAETPLKIENVPKNKEIQLKCKTEIAQNIYQRQSVFLTSPGSKFKTGKFNIFNQKKVQPIKIEKLEIGNIENDKIENDFFFIDQLCKEEKIKIFNFIDVETDGIRINDNIDLEELQNKLDESKSDDDENNKSIENIKKNKENNENNENDDNNENMETEKTIEVITDEQKMLDELILLENITSRDDEKKFELPSRALKTERKTDRKFYRSMQRPTLLSPEKYNFKNSILSQNTTQSNFFTSLQSKKEKRKIEKLRSTMNYFYENCQDEITKFEEEKKEIKHGIKKINRKVHNDIIKLNKFDIPLSNLHHDFKYYTMQREFKKKLIHYLVNQINENNRNTLVNRIVQTIKFEDLIK